MAAVSTTSGAVHQDGRGVLGQVSKFGVRSSSLSVVLGVASTLTYRNLLFSGVPINKNLQKSRFWSVKVE